MTGIATQRHGSAIVPEGIDLASALKADDLSSVSISPFTGNSLEFIRTCGADVLFENTPVDYKTGQPAVDHLFAALDADMLIVTANKGPVVHAYEELIRSAASKERKFYFE